MTNEIPPLTSNAHVERPEQDPTHREDPYGRRKRRPPPAPPRSRRAPKAAAPPDPAPTLAPDDQPVVGSRLDVRG